MPIIVQKFWHLFLELVCAELPLRYGSHMFVKQHMNCKQHLTQETCAIQPFTNGQITPR
jgi:hypothetical protein